MSQPGELAPTGPADPAKTAVANEWKHTSPLIACRFDPSGRYVFAGAQDNTIQRWDVATGQQVAFAGHDSWVRAIAFDSTGETLYTAGYDGRLMWWPAAADAPAPTRTIDAHRGWVRAIAVSPDGKLLATAGNDNLVRLWSAADGAAMGELSGHSSHVYNVAFHPGGEHLASADLKGVVKHWSVPSLSEVRQLDASPLYKYDTNFCADLGGARGMSFSPDGKMLACGGITNVSNAFAGVGNPAVVLFDWESGKPIVQHSTQVAEQGTIWGLAFHPDGFLIGAVGGPGGGILCYWKAEAPGEFFKFRLPDTARDLGLHKDGLRVAVAHHDGNLRIYWLA